MLRLVDGQAVESEAETLATLLREGKRVALRCDRAMDQDQLLAATVRALNGDVVVATVPASLDQVTRTALELASAVDPRDRERIDEALRDPSGIEEAFSRLDQALAGRTVILDRIENLAPPQHDEVAEALYAERRALGRWIRRRADLMTVQLPPVGESGVLVRSFVASDTPPTRLQNGAEQNSSARWEDCKDARTFELMLALEALGADAEPEGDTDLLGGRSPDSLREALWNTLPEGVTALLKTLAVHGRPLALDVLRSLPEYLSETDELGRGLALWRVRADRAVVDPGWSDWCARQLSDTERMETHRLLAETFAREVSPEDPSARFAGLSVAEAHRHFLQLGEVERALHHARYGAELVVGRARDLSLDRRFEESAAIYDRLLSKPYPLSPRLRAYAKHYLHYNRAHARPELEPVVETARGYEDSLRDWKENAIFWSRAVRARYLAGDRTRARLCLLHAQQFVPDHRDKGTRLIARTARRLAEFGMLTDAIEVWGDYTPDTMRAQEDAEQLRRRLEAGWDTDRLELPQIEPLVFLHRERFRIIPHPGGWRFVAEQLGRSERCRTPLESAQNFVQKVRDEVKTLLRKLDRDLDEEARERKGVLLARVDVIESRLDARAAKTTWVYGKVERDEHDAIWLVSGGNVAARYAVPEELSATLVVGDNAWLAEVETGPSGVPRGPVRALEKLPRQDPESVRRQWRERLGA